MFQNVGGEILRSIKKSRTTLSNKDPGNGGAEEREGRGGGEWVPESEKFAAGFCSLDGCRPCGRRQTPPIYSTTLRILPMAIVVPKYRIILNIGRLGFWTRLLCPSAR